MIKDISKVNAGNREIVKILSGGGITMAGYKRWNAPYLTGGKR